MRAKQHALPRSWPRTGKETHGTTLREVQAKRRATLSRAIRYLSGKLDKAVMNKHRELAYEYAVRIAAKQRELNSL